jgi:Flp pilus assembly pilin Flp
MPTVASLRRFIAEEDGQDLMEYVLLCAFVALTGILVWQGIVTLLGVRYVEYNSQVQDIWASPDP